MSNDNIRAGLRLCGALCRRGCHVKNFGWAKSLPPPLNYSYGVRSPAGLGQNPSGKRITWYLHARRHQFY